MKTRMFYAAAMLLCSFFAQAPQNANAQCSNEINLVSNSDFSSGFSGYSSGLTLTTTSGCTTNRYGIGTAFDDFCGSFPSTPSGVDMMVVDFGFGAPSTMVLQRSISGVAAGINYTVGLRGASRFGANPVPLDVFYAGNLIGTITINSPSSFNNFSFNWTPPVGVASSGNLRFVVASPAATSDFAVTDIEFSYCADEWRKTYENGKDQNHFSIAEVNDDYVVAGTLYPPGALTNTTVGVKRFDALGNMMWQNEYDLDNAYDARCFDVEAGPDETLALTGYVQQTSGSRKLPFIMILDASSGSVLEFQEYSLGSFDHGTGLDLIYSKHTESYYVAGYESDDILDVNTTKAGFVLNVDRSLRVNWINQITSAATADEHNMANDLTEIPGKGIFVTGSVNKDQNVSGSGIISTLKLLLDYSGNTIWDLTTISTNSHECGVDAVYDVDKDQLYVMSNNSVVHTFEIKLIENASSAAASIVMTAANDLYGRFNGTDVEGFTLSFDPNSDENLLVAGMIAFDPPTESTPSFIANVSKSSFAVTSLYYAEPQNVGYRSHDHDVFRAYYWQQAYINYPDILAVSPNHLVVLGYEHRTGNSLSISRTNSIGSNSAVEDCEVSISAPDINSVPTFTGAEVQRENANSNAINTDVAEDEYDVLNGCLYAIFDKPTNVAQVPTSDAVKVYPNPATNVLTIEMPNTSNATQADIRLYNAMGQIVVAQTATYGTVELDVAKLPNGIYYLSVDAGVYQAQQTVVITH